MKTAYTKIALTLAGLIVASASYGSDEPRAVLKGNRTIVYKDVPKSVENFSEMFTEGKFYGRIRSNSFYWKWKDELQLPNGTYIRKDNYISGLGGSVVYKTATWNGLSAEAGVYVSEAVIHPKSSDVLYLKAGKDVTSRYNVLQDGNWPLYSLAIANIDYKYSKTDLRVGRMMFESFLTKSNDTKMIPNTFEGAVVTSKDISKTTLKFAYLTRQKLRDHGRFHDVLTYASPKAQNGDRYTDDSASHRGLSVANLQAHGKDTDNDLIVAEMINKSLPNLYVMLNYTAVPSLISSATAELKYTIKLDGISITPGIRYMQQFDNGAGEVGGANLLTVTTGYDDPNSLDTYLIAAKIDMKVAKAWKFRLGYSSVADKADIVAPWRGFPTGGYTRAMGQYNWQANTQTYLARVDYSLDKAKLVKGLSMMFRFAHQNFDEAKKTVMTDSNVYNFDLIHKLPSLPGFETRLRAAYIDADNYVGKDYSPSYGDYRLEFNYMF